MDRSFLIVPVSVIPEWTKNNVQTYPQARFSNDGQFIVIDNAHPSTTFYKWLGPNADQLPAILSAAEVVTFEQFTALTQDAGSVWFGGDE